MLTVRSPRRTTGGDWHDRRTHQRRTVLEARVHPPVRWDGGHRGGLPAILAACTGAGENTPSPAPSGATGAGATTGTLRVGWSSEPDTLNPLTSFSTEANEVLQLIYDKLNDYDANLDIQASLAETTTASADGKTVTYALRQGVTWHDGTPFTADDVVFTFSSIKGGGSSQYAQWLTDMTGVTAVDPQTVEVQTARP